VPKGSEAWEMTRPCKHEQAGKQEQAGK
jgi:hypothetical protein